MHAVRRFTFLLLGLMLVGILGCSPQQQASDPSSQPAQPAEPVTASEERPTRGDPAAGGTRGLEPIRPMAPITDYRARWAVIIGIDAYPGGNTRLKPLKYAVNDAREIRDLLQGEFGYPPDHVRYLADEEATLEAIRNLFARWLVGQEIREADSLFLFFAGHGLIEPDTQEGFLAAVDSQATDLEGSCLAVSWIRDRLKELPCRHKLVVFDSCYSGSLFQEKPSLEREPDFQIASNGRPATPADPDGSGQRGADQPASREATGGSDPAPGFDNLAYYFNRPAFLGISAGRLTPVADGSGQTRHSVFTATLLEVLRQRADTPRDDHAFTFRQVAAQVETRVANALGSRQIPDWGRLGAGDGDFVFRPLVRRLTPRELARREVYARQIAQANGQLETGNIGQTDQILDACNPQLRGWEWDYLKGLCHADLRTLRGHTSRVNCVAFSPDGGRIASASGVDAKPGEVILWDAQTGDRLQTLEGHLFMTTGVAFSPDSGQLASAGWDASVLVWEVDTGRRRLKIETGQGRVYGVAFSPDGRRIASAGEDKTVRVWDATDGRPIQSLDRHQGPVRSLAFSPKGRRIASAGEDRAVLLWDLEADAEPLRLDGHAGPVVSLAFSPDDGLLVSGEDGGTVIGWDTATGQQSFSRRQPGGVRGVAFSPNGERIALAGRDHRVHLWNANTREPIGSFRGHAGPVVGVAFSPDGGRIASAGDDRVVKLWDAAGPPGDLTFREHAQWVNDVAFGPQGRTVASASEDGAVKLWDPQTGRLLFDLAAHEIAARCVAFSPDGRQLISGGADLKVKGWDVETGAERFTREGFGGTVNCLAFSPDGTRFAAGSADKTVQVWDAETQQRLLTFEGHTHSVNGLAFSPDGSLVFSAAGSKFARTRPECKLWRATTGEEILALALETESGYVQHAAFSPDGKWLASAGPDHRLRVWDAGSGRVHFQREAQSGRPTKDYLTAVAFSPDGSRLASASRDGTVTIWDATSGLPLFTVHRFDSPVTAVVFSPQGNRLAASSRDKTVRIWAAAPKKGSSRD